MRVFDIAVHSWDLAVAIGQDGTLDDVLAKYVLAIVEGEEPGMGFAIEPLEITGPNAGPWTDCSTSPGDLLRPGDPAGSRARVGANRPPNAWNVRSCGDPRAHAEIRAWGSLSGRAS